MALPSEAATKQTGPRSARGARTRARLVEAAKAVFERDGFLAARIIDIAEAASVGIGTFYHYFDSKEQIFREVAAELEQRLTAPIEGLPPVTDEESLAQSVEMYVRRYLTTYRDEVALMRVIEQMSRIDDEVNAARMETLARYSDAAEAAIRRLQEAGVVDAQLDAALAGDTTICTLSRSAELWIGQAYRRRKLDHMVEQLTRVLLNTLGVRSPQ